MDENVVRLTDLNGMSDRRHYVSLMRKDEVQDATGNVRRSGGIAGQQPVITESLLNASVKQGLVTVGTATPMSVLH